jgi:Glycosyl hydrolases family 25
MTDSPTRPRVLTARTGLAKWAGQICRALRRCLAWSRAAAALGAVSLACEPAPDISTPSAGRAAFGIESVRGIDISASAGEPAFQDFSDLKQQGYRCVIVGGWGGVNRNPHAQVQSSRARSAGLLSAGYCYLNFATVLDGGWQVGEAIAAFGAEAAHLGFLAIDVESDASNQLSPGLQAEPPDASAQRDAVARIAEAVQAVRRAGLCPVIYTKKSYWKRVTGNTAAFSSLPLWWTQVGPASLSEPDLSSPAWTFGGWTNYAGKQCALQTTATPSAFPVDLDIFDRDVFAPSNPNRKADSVQIAVNQ